MWFSLYYVCAIIKSLYRYIEKFDKSITYLSQIYFPKVQKEKHILEISFDKIAKFKNNRYICGSVP